MRELNEYDRLVYLTLAYSSCFNFALTKEEIIFRLPKTTDLGFLLGIKRTNTYRKILFSKKKINDSLKKMINWSLIETDGEYFYLNELDLISRKNRFNLSLGKKKRIEEFIRLAKKIPFIKAISLTGSTAVNNAQKEDDLDFMIICQKNTLWLTRFILIILTKLKSKRPLLGKNDAWCFNLWLDEKDLSINEDRRSLYEAYEILQMIFVFDREKYQELFLNANQWVKNYLFFYVNFNFKEYKETINSSFFNKILFLMQKKYRLILFGQENFFLTETQAFFNHVSFRKKIFTRLRKKLSIFNE